MPICQRCTGLYVGSAYALACWALLRPQASALMLWVHGVLLLIMIPFGYHLVPQSGDIRTVTGLLFAFGLIYYMAVYSWKRPPRTSARYAVIYLSCIAAGIPLLLVAVHAGGHTTGIVLSVLAAAGALALLTVSAVTVFTLGRHGLRAVLHG